MTPLVTSSRTVPYGRLVVGVSAPNMLTMSALPLTTPAQPIVVLSILDTLTLVVTVWQLQLDYSITS